MDKNIDSRLSKRMLAVAEMVRSCKYYEEKEVSDQILVGDTAGCDHHGFRVADIGCDHAFVSIYLIQHGIADMVIAADVNPGPLETAKSNIMRYGISMSENSMNNPDNDLSGVNIADSDIGIINIRLSNGFEKIKKAETDAAVIAGMGGRLIISIIDGADVFVPGYRLILSPQSDVPEVRLYLLEHGFRLMDEDMIEEDGKYYNIIWAEFVGAPQLEGKTGEAAALNDKNTAQPEESEEKQILIKYGENLIKKKDPVFKEYLEKRRTSLGTIYKNLAEPCSPLVVTRREEIKAELDEIDIVLGKLV
ncbi:MAG: SAM-dependent methyltransferase [Eubacterium sp.]|nr:SAM-dependent methyltransferase [Eubacterium sp.]